MIHWCPEVRRGGARRLEAAGGARHAAGAGRQGLLVGVRPHTARSTTGATAGAGPALLSLFVGT